MPVIDSGELRLYYERWGEHGDPAVLVHGSLIDHHTWDAVAPLFAQSLEVLVYDRRSYGGSRGPPRTRPVRDDAEDLTQLLRRLDLHPVHVIAHSYAGAVAIRFAIDHPEMVRSLCLHEPPFAGLLALDPTTASEGEQILAETRAIQVQVRAGDRQGGARRIVNVFSGREGAWERLSAPVRAIFEGLVDRWVEELDDPEAIRPDLSSLPDLLPPVLLTSGLNSPPPVRRINQALGPLLRNAVVRDLPDVGHIAHVTDPALFAGVVMEFLLEREVPVD